MVPAQQPRVASQAAHNPAPPAMPERARPPRFTEGGGAPSAARSAAVIAAPARATSAQRSSFVGASLSEPEIQAILSHAGSGCPLGPCQGCPHNNLATGACEA